eukprot:3720732-Pyramimonas_sp.AAC.1
MRPCKACGKALRPMSAGAMSPWNVPRCWPAPPRRGKATHGAGADGPRPRPWAMSKDPCNTAGSRRPAPARSRPPPESGRPGPAVLHSRPAPQHHGGRGRLLSWRRARC